MDLKTNSCRLLFDVGGTFLKAVAADSAGGLIPGSEFSCPMPSDGTREAITGALAASVARGAAFAARNGLVLAGIGIAFPGPFDYANGIPRMEHKFRSIYGAFACRPAARASGDGTRHAGPLYARCQCGDAGRDDLGQCPGCGKRRARDARDRTRLCLLPRARSAVLAHGVAAAGDLQLSLPRRHPRKTMSRSGVSCASTPNSQVLRTRR